MSQLLTTKSIGWKVYNNSNINNLETNAENFPQMFDKADYQGTDLDRSFHLSEKPYLEDTKIKRGNL